MMIIPFPHTAQKAVTPAKPSATLPAQSILDLIGSTPLVKVSRIDTGLCDVYLKLESQNPGGSIKDRIALSMIEAAERDGRIKPGDTLVEATAGNTGLGLTLVAAQKGYKLILVIPDKMSQEKIFHMKAMGAEVIMTRSDVLKGHPDYYQDKARAIAEGIPGAFYVNQFENPANPATHERTTGPEIWEQMNHKIDTLVCGAGSGGTLTGLGRYFARTSPRTEIVLADPDGSILAPYVNHGVMVEPGNWLIEGIGEDFIPANCELRYARRAYSISDEESINTAREVLLHEGILCGSSSGTLIAATLRYARAQTRHKRIVTFVCDSGNKYLSKIYNHFWLQDHGLTDRKETHDLRDLIARPYLRGDVISVTGGETLQQVYAKMKTFDVSQVPVMDGDKIIGIINETDVLLAVVGNLSGFSIRAGEIMTSKFTEVPYTQSMTGLLPVIEQGRVVAVVDRGHFLGLITPIDFLNYLRKRTAQG